MKFVLRTIFSCLIIFLAVSYFSNKSSARNRENRDAFPFSSSPLFVFAVLNFIVLLIILGSYRPSSHEVEIFFPSNGEGQYVHYRNEADEDDECKGAGSKPDEVSNQLGGAEGKCGDDSSSISDEGSSVQCDSEGYVEDDSSGNDGEVGWDEEDGNSNLEERIELFIAKVITGWWEERTRGNSAHAS